MDIKQRIGIRIRDIRKARGFTQAKLAELVGISDKTQSCLENGKHFPSLDVLEKYPEALNVKIEDILNISNITTTDEKLYEINQFINKANEMQIDMVYKFVKSISF